MNRKLWGSDLDKDNVKKFFQEKFSAFKTSFWKSVCIWSDNQIDGMIKDISLYAEVKCEFGGELKYRYLISEKSCENLENQDDALKIISEQYQDAQIERKESSQVKNTGLGKISEQYPYECSVIWIAVYKKSKTDIYKVIANVILSLLVDEFNNINQLSLESAEIEKKFLGEKIFMEYYIREMRKCFKYIPKETVICSISALHYEKRECCGQICFLGDISELKEEMMVHIDQKCYLRGGCEDEKNVMAIRKLLEVCRNSGNCLVAVGDCMTIVGIVSKLGSLIKEQSISICFYGNQWELFRGRETLVYYQNGRYYINREKKNDSLKKKCLQAGLCYNLFGDFLNLLNNDSIGGALLIVAEDAETETDRLCLKYKRGTKIEKFKIDEQDSLGKYKWHQLLLGMTNVDGAVLLDFDGNCYGYGIILDGIALVEGKADRGARYNSAITYLANNGGKRRCAVIRSEDKEKELEIKAGEIN